MPTAKVLNWMPQHLRNLANPKLREAESEMTL
jgi:hypothetical protein